MFSSLSKDDDDDDLDIISFSAKRNEEKSLNTSEKVEEERKKPDVEYPPRTLTPQYHYPTREITIGHNFKIRVPINGLMTLDDFQESTKHDEGGKYFSKALDPTNPLSIPYFVDMIINIIKKDFIKKQGLFRRNGSKELVDEVTEIIDDRYEDDLQEDELFEALEGDPHSIAYLLKLYLLEMSKVEPLCPFALYDQFIEIGIKTFQNKKKHCEELRSFLMHKLPKTHFILWRKLSFFLNEVAKCAKWNLMTPSNLSLVFSKYFVKPKVLDPSSINRKQKKRKKEKKKEKKICNLQICCNQVETLIKYPEFYFPDIYSKNWPKKIEINFKDDDEGERVSFLIEKDLFLHNEDEDYCKKRNVLKICSTVSTVFSFKSFFLV